MRRAAWRMAGVVLVMMGLLSVTRVGFAKPPAKRVVKADTVRVPRSSLLPRTPTLLETEYLDRLIEPAEEKDSQVETYASRYGITRKLARTILESARAEGVDPELGFRLVRVESGFSERAVSPVGALGLTQLMPGTARLLGLRTRSAILEPTNNLRVGFRYLRQMIRSYNGDVRLALLAYNRGPNAVNRALKRGSDPENGYSHKVLGTRSSNPYRGKGLIAE